MKLSALIVNQILIVMFVFFYEYDIYLAGLVDLGKGGVLVQMYAPC